MPKEETPIIGAKSEEKPLTMANLVQKARDDWSEGKRNEAFNTALSGLILVSKGVARTMMDCDALMASNKKLAIQLSEIEEELKSLKKYLKA